MEQLKPIMIKMMLFPYKLLMNQAKLLPTQLPQANGYIQATGSGGIDIANGVWNYTTSVLNWTLLDSTKHLDYAGSSVFSNYFHTAKDKWNAYKAGVVRFAMQSSAVDVVIVDDSYMKYRGLTSPSGTISINPNLVSLRSSEYSTTLKTCMHEMGHALGLGDNDSADVMYGTKSSTTTLASVDKGIHNKTTKYGLPTY